MGTTAIIAGILSLLASIGGFAGKKLHDKNAREMTNAMSNVDDSSKGITVASDVTGLAAQALSMFSGFGSLPSKPNSTQVATEHLKRWNAGRAKSLGLAFNPLDLK